MDRLDDLFGTARPMLDRVDQMLSVVGAPGEHRVWGELRRVRLLPGDAVRAVAALRPAALGEAGPEIRAEARACVEIAAGLPPPEEWTGEAAEAYDEARHRMAAQLSGGNESLDERMEATADLAEALREWMRQTRDDLARALAEALGSNEAAALTVTGGMPPGEADILGAADIAASLLRVVADNYAYAGELIRGSADLTVALPM
ncbi:hypothetical protein [Actinoplanes sp. NPDC051411]|uniref:hypothetical protein n=1 Tax=Actinoplanes sp. NPDC051411 TaxID=3155522 RepID=UPI00341D97FC